MLISKFDLYRSEWLDLVFADRNKAYGAYELRQHNSRATLKALAAMIGSIIVVAFVFGVVLKPAKQSVPLIVDRIVPMTSIAPPPPPAKPLKNELAKGPKPAEPPAQTHATIKVVPPVVTPDNQVTDEMPKDVDLESKVISTTTTPGTAASPGATAETPGKAESGGGSGTDDKSIYNIAGLQREPEPIGGFGAFGKFLEKHLRYPDEASDNKVQGKVFLSFIVEKDGSLSNITVLRGPGFGTNEEALRVLKLAPAWKPGIQNGQPVRVQYNIPINFQMGSDDNP